MKKQLKAFGLILSICALVLLAFAPSPAVAQGPYTAVQGSVFPNYGFGPQVFTATAQTGATVIIPGLASGTINVTGTGLTTATWAIQGSPDGGTTWTPLLTAAITVPGTTATSQTTTTSGSVYIVNVSGLTAIRFVTSGTFTATNLSLKLVASSNKGLL